MGGEMYSNFLQILFLK